MENWQHIRRLSKMETSEDIQAFEQKISELCENKDPSVILDVMDLFDDTCQFPEVMYSIVHAIEYYPDDIYVSSILKNMSVGLKNYPQWFLTLIYGILNHPGCLDIFRKNMILAPQESLLKLFDLVEQESPHHRKLITELRKEFEQNKTS